MIIALLKFFGYINKDDKNLPQSDVSGSLPSRNMKYKQQVEFGSPCVKCGNPNYGNKNKTICYCCDTDNWD